MVIKKTLKFRGFIENPRRIHRENAHNIYLHKIEDYTPR